MFEVLERRDDFSRPLFWFGIKRRGLGTTRSERERAGAAMPQAHDWNDDILTPRATGAPCFFFMLDRREKFMPSRSHLGLTCDHFGMRDDQHRFLMLMGCPPARLTVEQAAWMLGCQAHDMPVLIAAKLVRPLGNPAPNASKYFSTAELVEMIKDRSFLAKITNTVSRHWQEKNARKKDRPAGQAQGGSDSLELLAAG